MNRNRLHFFPLTVIIFFLAALAVMLLWNAILPDLFGLPLIGYWQSMGLLLLTRIIFAGGIGYPGYTSRHHASRFQHRLKKHWRNLNPQDREEFIRRFGRFHPCSEQDHEHRNKKKGHRFGGHHKNFHDRESFDNSDSDEDHEHRNKRKSHRCGGHNKNFHDRESFDNSDSDEDQEHRNKRKNHRCDGHNKNFHDRESFDNSDSDKDKRHIE